VFGKELVGRLSAARPVVIVVDRHDAAQDQAWSDPVQAGPVPEGGGSLHRQNARDGGWSRARGMPDNPKASVIRLAATAHESELDLLCGDAGVHFVLDDSGEPLVAHALHSYSLNHRTG
jgi:hypothetical protein